MKKMIALAIILSGAAVLSIANAAPAAPALNDAATATAVTADNNNDVSGQGSNPDLAQAQDPSTQATAGSDQAADNSDYSDSDDAVSNTDADSSGSNDDGDTN